MYDMLTGAVGSLFLSLLPVVRVRLQQDDIISFDIPLHCDFHFAVSL